MDFIPRGKLLVIRVVPNENEKTTLTIKQNSIKIVEILKKGDLCSDDYQVGDLCMIIDGQQYECKEAGITIVWDDDILGKII
jgi:hypothetical protein